MKADDETAKVENMIITLYLLHSSTHVEGLKTLFCPRQKKNEGGNEQNCIMEDTVELKNTSLTTIRSNGPMN